MPNGPNRGPLALCKRSFRLFVLQHLTKCTNRAAPHSVCVRCPPWGCNGFGTSCFAESRRTHACRSKSGAQARQEGEGHLHRSCCPRSVVVHSVKRNRLLIRQAVSFYISIVMFRNPETCAMVESDATYVTSTTSPGCNILAAGKESRRTSNTYFSPSAMNAT